MEQKPCTKFVLFRANNETLPWTEKEVQWPVLPMPKKNPTKLVRSYRQVGDYYAMEADTQQVIPLVIERKTIPDLYGTMMCRLGRERFYKEIHRFETDDRFTDMIIIVEGSYSEFLSYQPNGEPGAHVNARIASIASLFARGVPVMFCGSRALAINFSKNLFRQFCLKKGDKRIDDLGV